MKLNRKWINEEFVDLSNVSDKDFVETLTVFGQKVETYERLDSEIKNVVVGKVLSMTRHENSDHMWVCQVDVGKDEPVQIVTGAQNVHEGDLVPAALHNSYLPGGVHITKGKLRGVASNGMLCSLKELGLTLGDFPYAIEDGIWTWRRKPRTCAAATRPGWWPTSKSVPPPSGSGSGSVPTASGPSTTSWTLPTM